VIQIIVISHQTEHNEHVQKGWGDRWSKFSAL
jgi:hypothetical protein